MRRTEFVVFPCFSLFCVVVVVLANGIFLTVFAGCSITCPRKKPTTLLKSQRTIIQCFTFFGIKSKLVLQQYSPNCNNAISSAIYLCNTTSFIFFMSKCNITSGWSKLQTTHMLYLIRSKFLLQLVVSDVIFICVSLINLCKNRLQSELMAVMVRDNHNKKIT